MDFDLLIRGGRIVDGSGMPGYRGDLGIRQGRIAAIGHLAGSAARTIEADGLVVAPGFIDHHTHLDAQLFWDPYGTCEPQHGVTSVVMGNCGLTLAPVTDRDREELLTSFVRVEAMPRKSLEAGIPWGWQSFREYLDALDGRTGINVGCLVGHIAIRHQVMGRESLEREGTDQEIDDMRALLAESLEGGALGFSTNRNHRHMREDGQPVSSRLASEEEVFRLSEVLRDMSSGIILSSSGAKTAFFDTLARRSERPVIWQSVQHRWNMPNEWREQLDAIARTFDDGYRAYGICNIVGAVRQFTLRKSQQFDEMPAWKTLSFLPEEERKKAMAAPEMRARLQADMDDPRPITFHKRWDLIDIIAVARPENQPYIGKSVADVAAMRGQLPLEAFLDLSLEEDLQTSFETSNTGGDPEATAEIMRSPHIILGTSDAGAHVQFNAAFGYTALLLGRWVRERQAMSLEQAVSKLTFQVASIYGLDDRGLLRPGLAADVTVFDPATITAARPEWAEDFPGDTRRLVQRSPGIQATVVNGTVIYENGRMSGDLPGRVLRGSAYRA